MTSQICKLTFDWQGISVEVLYVPDWQGLGHTAWLEIQSVPPKTPLPITETGYRSHFHPQGLVEAAGGPEAFVSGWLDDAATKHGWQRTDARNQQLSLF